MEKKKRLSYRLEYENLEKIFHSVKNSDSSVIEINSFNRFVFNLTQSPFILEGTLKRALPILH